VDVEEAPSFRIDVEDDAVVVDDPSDVEWDHEAAESAFWEAAGTFSVNMTPIIGWKGKPEPNSSQPSNDNSRFMTTLSMVVGRAISTRGHVPRRLSTAGGPSSVGIGR
jgi:hypothetical protein